jgi:hypothetical protein
MILFLITFNTRIYEVEVDMKHNQCKFFLVSIKWNDANISFPINCKRQAINNNLEVRT